MIILPKILLYSDVKLGKYSIIKLGIQWVKNNVYFRDWELDCVEEFGKLKEMNNMNIKIVKFMGISWLFSVI